MQSSEPAEKEKENVKDTQCGLSRSAQEDDGEYTDRSSDAVRQPGAAV